MNTASFSKTGPGAPSDLWTPVLGPSVLLNMEGDDHLALRRKLGPALRAGVRRCAGRRFARRGDPRAGRAARRGRARSTWSRTRGAARRRSSAGWSGLDDETSIDDELFARVSAVTGFVSLARPRLTAAQLAVARGILSRARRARGARLPRRRVDGARPDARARPRRARGARRGRRVRADRDRDDRVVPAAARGDPRSTAGGCRGCAADRALVEPAIAEGLRVTTPSPVMLRSTIAADRIGDVAVRPGDRIILATFAANRALGEFDPETNAGGAAQAAVVRRGGALLPRGAAGDGADPADARRAARDAVAARRVAAARRAGC